LVGERDNASGTLTANGNGTGELAWGAVTTDGAGSFTQILYAMSSNQGIQAFAITVPEPSTLAFGALGGIALLVDGSPPLRQIKPLLSNIGGWTCVRPLFFPSGTSVPQGALICYVLHPLRFVIHSVKSFMDAALEFV